MVTTWNDEETLKLIELWGDEEIQALLEGYTRNKHVFKKIAARMTEAGYDQSGVQCRDKIKKLKGEYKKIKDSNNETGRNRKTWKFYDPMNEILGNKPATRPAVVIDSSLEQEVVRDNVEGDEGRSEDVVDEEHETEVEKGVEKCDTEKEMHGEQAEEKGGKAGEVGETTITKTNNKRKKHSREDKFEKVLQSIVHKVTQTQKESDVLFLKLEEKRMKFDERMMEMEDRRLREDKEREKRQRREEREFQMRMMMCMQQARIPPPTPQFSGYNYSFHNSSGESSQWPDSDMS